MGKTILGSLNRDNTMFEFNSVNTKKEYKKYVNFSVLKKNIFAIISISIILIMAAVYVYFIGYKKTSYVLGAVIIVLIVIMIIISEVVSSSYIKLNPYYSNSKVTQNFFSDIVLMSTLTEKTNYESVFSYQEISKIYLTKTNVYIYLHTFKSLIVDLGSIKGGTYEEFIAMLFSKVGSNKIRTQYGLKYKI